MAASRLRGQWRQLFYKPLLRRTIELVRLYSFFFSTAAFELLAVRIRLNRPRTPANNNSSSTADHYIALSSRLPNIAALMTAHQRLPTTALLPARPGICCAFVCRKPVENSEYLSRIIYKRISCRMSPASLRYSRRHNKLAARAPLLHRRYARLASDKQADMSISAAIFVEAYCSIYGSWPCRRAV